MFFQGLLLKYKLEMTNGETFWRKHFSADERCMYMHNGTLYIVLAIENTGHPVAFKDLIKIL